MDGVSVTKPLSKRGSVRYASAPLTARTGNADASLNILRILRRSGWEPPLEPVELRPPPAVGGQGCNEAGSPVREGGAVHSHPSIDRCYHDDGFWGNCR